MSGREPSEPQQQGDVSAEAPGRDEAADLTARARGLRGRPLAEHADTYDEIHAALHAALADIDTR